MRDAKRSPWRAVVAFAPMCAVAAISWAELLVGPPFGRIAALVALATGCGLVLVLSARLEPHGRAEARIVRVATVAVALVLGVLAAGIPPQLLVPTGWQDLAAGLSSGVDGLPRTWPYDGGELWVRRTVLLAIPIMTIPAAAFALSPPAAGPGGPEAAAVRRVGALLLLISLIAFAGSERALADPAGRGALLLAALAAWLFLPRLPARPAAALAGGVVVIAAGLASLPVAAALDPGEAAKQARAQATSPAPARPGGEQARRTRERPERRSRSERRRRSERPDSSQRRRSGSGRERRRGGRDRTPPSAPDRPRPSERGEGEQGLPAAVIVLVLAAALAVAFVLLRRRRRSQRDEAEELRRVLERLGWSVPPGTTLAELERRLDDSAGPVAARYARRLRERRFGAPGARVSAAPDRRALRRALTAGHGPRVWLLGLLALPPAALDLRQ